MEALPTARLDLADALAVLAVVLADMTVSVDPGTVAADVARGVAWLDEVEPGWHNRIVLDLLDMMSTRQCVLGQVFAGHVARQPLTECEEGCGLEVQKYDNGYEYALGLLPLTSDTQSDSARDHGFFHRPHSGHDSLRREWKRVVQDRREDAGAQV